jgi:tRNA 2-selenouridine synthase
MQKISATDLLQLPPDRALLDVRTPAEYAQGHVPGALNLPLFSDEERAEVGTLYKQASPERAFLRGLDLAGAKLSGYVREAVRLAPGRQLAVHCWRGGQRSGSMAALLSFAGFDVQVVQGGYKAYRQLVQHEIANRSYRYVVLGGRTGSGKTLILNELAKLGEQVVDLEGMARHKGSAFGALGEAPQPTVEQFENELLATLDKFDPQRRVWVENESRSIGRVFLHEGFFAKIKSGPLVSLEVPFEERVRYLVHGYANFPKEELLGSLEKITKRMGGQHVKAAREAFESGDVEAATSIVLTYYDKTYDHSTSLGDFSQRLFMEVEKIEPGRVAGQLLQFAEGNGI